MNTMQQMWFRTTYFLQKEWVIILLLLLISSITFFTLFFTGYFNHHDDLQVMRIFEMEKCFADGQIPCRWVPDMGYGYGYPLFNFYPPLPAFLGVLVRFFSFGQIQIVDAVKVTFALQSLVGAVLMYLFAKKWWGRLGGFLSATFYTFAPYHALDLYVRGAQNEAWGMSFAPGVGWAMTRLYEKRSFNNVVLLALMFTGMLLSHNLMVLIFTPLFVMFGLYLVIVSRSAKLLIQLALGGILAFCISSFFSLPVVLEQKYVHIETLYIGFFNYIVHFATFNQLFISRFWGYGGSLFGPKDEMAFPIGWLHWGGVVVVMLASLWLLYKKHWKTIFLVTIFGGYFWLTAFLAHERSSEIFWKHIPILHTLQFPWRFLSTTTFTSSFLIGALFLLPLTKLIRFTLFASLLISVVAINNEFFHVEHRFPWVDDKTKLSAHLWDQQRTSGIFDYLPMQAVRPPGRPAPGNYQIINGNVEITNFASGSAHVAFTANAKTDSIIRLNIFDFPFWRVFIDEKQVPHDHNNYMGLITFTIPQGEHTVKAKLTNTPVRTAANAISLVTIVGLSVWYARKIFLGRYGKRT